MISFSSALKDVNFSMSFFVHFLLLHIEMIIKGIALDDDLGWNI